MAATSTLKAFQSRFLLWVEKVLPSLRWVVIGRDQVTHDCQVGKFRAPSPPLTNCAQRPTPVRCKILTTATTEGMSSVREGVHTDIEQIVAE